MVPTATAASVTAFRKGWVKVAYHEVIDANAQDCAPSLLRARNAGAEVVVVWSDSTGLDARLMNARARVGWDVVLAGHPAMGSGAVANLLDKKSNWEKVYIVGYRPCTFDASGKLPARTQEFVDSVKGKIDARRYVAVVGRCRGGCGEPGGRGGGEDRVKRGHRDHRLLDHFARLAGPVRPYTFTPTAT